MLPGGDRPGGAAVADGLPGGIPRRGHFLLQEKTVRSKIESPVESAVMGPEDEGSGEGISGGQPPGASAPQSTPAWMFRAAARPAKWLHDQLTALRARAMLSMAAPPRPGKQPPEAPFSKEIVITADCTLVHMLYMKSTYIVFMAAVAFLYTQLGFRRDAPTFAEKDDLPRTEDGELTGFQYGMFERAGSCGEDMEICCCSFFCISIRWAHTVSHERVKLGIGFWAAVVLINVCDAVGEDFPCTLWFVFAAAGLAIAVFYRQRLRARFGIQHGTCMSVGKDTLAWLCCCYCAAAQEARQVEHVRLGTDC